MNLTILIRLSRILFTSTLLGLLAGLALAACANGTPEVEIILSDTPTPSPTRLVFTPRPLNTVINSFATATPSFTSPITQTIASDLYAYFGPTYVQGLTMTFELRVTNRMPTLAPGILFLFKDRPVSGNKPIAQIEIPNITTEFLSISITWDMTGMVGEHTFFSFICPINVSPSPNTCQVSQEFVTIPRLNFDIEVSSRQLNFKRGDQIPIEVFAANLDPIDTLVFTMTILVDERDDRSPLVLVTESITLLPGELVERNIMYDTTDSWTSDALLILSINGIPELQVRALKERYAEVYLEEDAYFIAEPLSGTVPLTVTFIDRSAPFGRIESWEWSFGDGMTSTLRTPTHVYTESGSYTVALTTTVPSKHTKSGRIGITQGIAPQSILTETTVFTIVRSHYITALLRDQGP